MNTRRKNLGATLIEQIIVMVLLAILATGGMELVRLGFMSYAATNDIIDADWQGTIALERMVRDLRGVRSSLDISTANLGRFVFTDASGNSVDYQVTGSQLMRNSQALADDVQSLAFSYFNSSGGAAATTADIRYITITLTIDNGKTFEFETGVSLWNLI